MNFRISRLAHSALPPPVANTGSRLAAARSRHRRAASGGGAARRSRRPGGMISLTSVMEAVRREAGRHNEPSRDPPVRAVGELMMVRFGYGLITCQRYPGDLRNDTDLYREALELAEEAERLGFDSVWTSEHHFADDAYTPSLLPLPAAIAARTRSILIGTGLLLAPLYPPLRLAEDAAVVDLLSQGRLVLGLGLGWLDWEFDALGVPLGERARLTEEAIRICRQGWGEGLVEGPGVAVHPKPARPGGPPIWLGGHVEPAVRRAARLADGWMAGEP